MLRRRGNNVSSEVFLSFEAEEVFTQMSSLENNESMNDFLIEIQRKDGNHLVYIDSKRSGRANLVF